MSHRGALAVAITFALGAGAARAEVDEPPPDDDSGDDSEPKLITGGDQPPGDDDEPAPIKDHHRQFGVSLQIPIGARAIKTYDAADYCGKRGDEDPNAPLCVARNPATLDFGLAYGIKPNIEVLMEFRVGLERDFGATATTGNGPRLFHWSPGLKVYFSDAGVSKLFSTAQIAFDFTGYEDASGESRGVDFVLRNVNGLQLDFHPSYGLYVFVGEELGFRRWLLFGIEAGIGIQGRYP